MGDINGDEPPAVEPAPQDEEYTLPTGKPDLGTYYCLKSAYCI